MSISEEPSWPGISHIRQQGGPACRLSDCLFLIFKAKSRNSSEKEQVSCKLPLLELNRTSFLSQLQKEARIDSKGWVHNVMSGTALRTRRGLHNTQLHSRAPKSGIFDMEATD